MAASITALVGYIGDSGVTAALTRRADVGRESEAAAFWIALSGGLVLGVVCAVGAPLLGWYYGSTRIAWLAAALSMAFVIAAPSRVPVAQLTRNLRFRALAGLTATSSVFGIAAGIVAASHGMGPWSLVLQLLTTFGTQSVFGQVLYPAPMRLSRAKHGKAKEIAREGSHIGGFGLCVCVSRAFDPIVAGRAFGAEPLGAVGMADWLLHVPAARMAAAINNVFLPVLTRLRGNEERGRAFASAARMALLVITPVAFGIPAIGGLLLSLLPARWWAVVQYLPIIGAIALAEPIIQLSVAILTVEGRTSALLRAGVTLVPLGWALSLLGGRGPDMRWMLGCVLGWYAVEAAILFWLACRCLNRHFDLHVILARPMLCGALMFAAFEWPSRSAGHHCPDWVSR